MSSEQKSSINLKGSVDLVGELLNYGVNSILYQRGIYPADMFRQVHKYGLTILVTNDEKLLNYLNIIMKQLKIFLMNKNVHRIVLVIINLQTNETVEKWQFNVKCQKNITITDTVEGDLKEIQNGIRDVIRQITASVTFLPSLDGSYSFDILLYTDKDTSLPSQSWVDSVPHLIVREQIVPLRNFTTNIHKVDAFVSYKGAE